MPYKRLSASCSTWCFHRCGWKWIQHAAHVEVCLLLIINWKHKVVHLCTSCSHSNYQLGSVFTHRSSISDNSTFILAHAVRFCPIFHQHLHANLISRSTSAGNDFPVQAVWCGVDKEGGRWAVSDHGRSLGWRVKGGRGRNKTWRDGREAEVKGVTARQEGEILVEQDHLSRWGQKEKCFPSCCSTVSLLSCCGRPPGA